MTKPSLPEPIAAYFRADEHPGESIAHCFTEQAVVKDEGRTHSGHAAIEAWKLDASTKYTYTSEPLALEQQDGRYIVSTRVTGNFPGSPVDLRFFFRLERDKIAFLEVIP